MEVIIVIGERLKALRKEKKLSQEVLANAIGVQKSAVSRYEANRDDPSDKVKVAIAKYCNISLDYLLGVIDEQVPYYNKDTFFCVRHAFSVENKNLLSDFLDFLEYRATKYQ